MNLSDFFKDGPQLTDPKHGAEPNLYRIIVHYYTSHGVGTHEATKMANDYIAACVKGADK